MICNMRKKIKNGRETLQTCFDLALDLLEESKAGYYYQNSFIQSTHIKSMYMELRFLKMFFWGLAYWEDLNYDWHLSFSINTMMFKLTQITKELGVHGKVIDKKPDQRINWDILLYDLEKAILEFKPQFKKICILLLGGDYKCTSCSPNQKSFLEYRRDTDSFMDFILKNVEELLKLDWIAPVMKQQILFIQEELKRPGLIFANPSNKLFDLISTCRTWSNGISSLTYLYFIDGNDESLAYFMDTVLSGYLHKTMPFDTYGPIASYFQSTTSLQLLASYLDFIIQNLAIPMKNDIEIVHESLIFLLSFIMHPPEDGDMIWVEIFGVINNFPALIHSIRFDVLKGRVCLDHFSDYLSMNNSLRVKAKDLCLINPYSRQFSSPNTNVIGFFNCLMENLKQMLDGEVDLILSLRHLGKLLQKELESIRSIVNNVIEPLQDKYVEIKDIWTKIVDMLYHADYIIKLCHAKNSAVWYGIVILPSFIEHVKLFVVEIKRVGVNEMYTKEMLTYHVMDATDAFVESRATNSNFEGAFIGFKKDKQVIIDYLTRGIKSLRIISISGWGGQGKTTLAKKIFNDRNVQDYFHNSMWCYVSKQFSAKEILIKIISDFKKNDCVNHLQTEELITHLWKNLKGKRYLIVLDDIWDVDAWRGIETSFPDDENGSRILFTSRNIDLAFEAKSYCSISHPLPLLCLEESWELMKRKVFGNSDCAGEFVVIGENIARYCKGLPLAVVLIAGILERVDKTLDKKRKLEMWNEVAENLKVYLAHEGCEKVIELSYKHLPNHLKSCFLYFGAFPRGQAIRAKELKLLWIGEGFIDIAHDSNMNVAKKYLNSLVSQSLVVVTEWSTLGEIKSCNIHDLLYDLCLEKASEDNFLYWPQKSLLRNNYINNGHHRLCIGLHDSFIKPKHIFAKTKLPVSPLNSLLWVHFPHASEFSFHFLESFKLLTVLSLSLSSVIKMFDEFPKTIACLVHLRYLKLIGSWYSECCPCLLALAHMGKLETLIIGYAKITLPMCVWRMKSLRHVAIHSSHLNLEDFDDHKISNFFGVEHSRIETLGSLYLDMKTVGFLQNFPQLKKLDCNFLKNFPILKFFSMIPCLTQLESLKIFGGAAIDSEPYEQNPQVWNFTDFENLKRLTLEDSNLSWNVVTEIGRHLPNLQVLKLLEDAMALNAKIWKLEEGDFPQLRYLKLSHIWGIEEIDVSSCDDDPPFPRLEHLVIDECHKFKEIPSKFGEILNLKTIKVIKSHGGKHVSALNTSAMVILEKQTGEILNSDFELTIDGRRQ